MEITDEAAKAALRVYVHHTGKPHDGMRAAILSVLPTEPERVADRYTPTAVTEEAIQAGLVAKYRKRGVLEGNIPGGLPGWSDVAVAEVRTVLTAALPHLTQPVKDGLGGEYWTERFDVLTCAVDALADKVERSTAPDYDRAFQRGVVIGRAEQEARELEQGEEVDEEAIFERGREVGRSEAAAYEGILEVATSPSDYEVWRDAWNLAAATSGPDFSPGAIRDNAEWFHERLKAGPPGPPVPDCSHCGADSSMDHDDDCPNGGTLQTGQDEDGVPYSRTVPTEQSGHADLGIQRGRDID